MRPRERNQDVHVVCLWVSSLWAQVTDFTIRYNGAVYAISNALLVAGMCTFERYLMTTANLGMSAIDINFHRVA